jgi:hypothetical protein
MDSRYYRAGGLRTKLATYLTVYPALDSIRSRIRSDAVRS